MISEVKLLAKVRLANLLGINEALHSKDEKKKHRAALFFVLYILLGALAVFYVSAVCLGLIALEAAETIPMFVFIVASAVVFFISVFRASSTLFNLKTYEREAALPIKPVSVVFAGLFVLYIYALAATAIIMIPGAVVYSMFAAPGAMFYIATILSIVLTPIIPLIAASALGAAVAAISARMKHRNIAGTLVSGAFAVIFVILWFTFTASSRTTSTVDKISEILSSIVPQCGNIYPVSSLYYNGVMGDVLSFVLFAALSCGVFAVFVFVLKSKFTAICSALATSYAKHNYTMQNQTKSSQLKALYKNELKRYFASRIYVINTAIGYIIMLMFAIAVLAVGAETVNGMVGIKGLVQNAAPAVLVFFCAISSSTACSISMEGKHWDITRSLPLTAKKLFDAKILVNLTVALPFWIVSTVLLFVALSPEPVDMIALVFLPLAVILLMSVLGIAVNAKHPKFDWENDVEVVKQGGGVGFTMFAGFGVIIVTVIVYLAVIIIAGMLDLGLFKLLPVIYAAVLIAITAVLYCRNNRIILTRIE